MYCAAWAGKRNPSRSVSGRVKIWLAVSSCFTASRIRFGPRPGESASARHARRFSSRAGVVDAAEFSDCVVSSVFMRARENARASRALCTRPLLSSEKTQKLGSCPTLQPGAGEVKIKLTRGQLLVYPGKHGWRD